VIKYSSILLCGKRIAHGYQKEEGAYNNKPYPENRTKKKAGEVHEQPNSKIV